MKNRFHLPDISTGSTLLELRGEEFHHAARVVRVEPGEEVEVFDGRGMSLSARVAAIETDHVRLKVLGLVEPSREPRAAIVVALALIHPDRFELVLQKGTELGAAGFIPMLTDRSESRSERVKGKQDRWRKIVLEAVKQCGRSRIPFIEEPENFQAVLARGGTTVVFEAGPDSSPLSQESALTCLIGPEGGWSERELEQARQAGAIVRSLGPRRLRAETAAIAGLTLLAHEVGNLR